MGDWFVGEMRMFTFSTVPAGWMQCQGQILSINQYAALYALIGAQYGGDGMKTFALPDLRGKVSISQGVSPTSATNYSLAGTGGLESVAVNTAQMPTHSHVFSGTSALATGNNPSGELLGNSTGGKLLFAPFVAATQTTLTPDSIVSVGTNTVHENRQPYLALNICIAVQGLFPPRP